MKKSRGDASLFMPGLGRREFIRRLGSSSAAAALAANALAAKARIASPSTGVGRVMLEELNHTLFAAQVGTTFDAQLGGALVPLELIEARVHAEERNRPAALARRAAFSLVFRAPRGTKAPQQIYDLSHKTMGKFGLFLVPIGLDEHGALYEAVFN